MKEAMEYELLIDADFRRFYGADWTKESRKSPIMALVRAHHLPPESFFKRANPDASRWTEEKSLMAMLDLRIQQLAWTLRRSIDGRSTDEAQWDDPYPVNLPLPEDILEEIEKSEKNKKKQEFDAKAEAVEAEMDAMKEALRAPRFADGVQEEEEDVDP